MCRIAKIYTHQARSVSVILLGLCLSAFTIVSGQAQQSLGIAAVVNEEMISMYDLNSRIDSVITFSGISPTPENRRRIAFQVLRGLIDERIKLQEATRLEITASESKLKTAKANFARQNRVEPSALKEFVSRNRLQESTIDEQIKASVVWNKIVATRYRRNVKITEVEINEIIQKHKKNKGKPEDLVYEIFLPVKNSKQEQEAVRLAERLVQQIKKGANFSAIAQNFSQSSSGGRGGTLGWTMRGELEPDLHAVVQTMKPGEIKGPVRTQEGVLIVLLQATRMSIGLDAPPAGPEKVKLFQLHLALQKEVSQEVVAQHLSRLQTETTNLVGCTAFNTLAKKIGSPLSGELGTFPINKISPKMQSLIKSVAAGRSSPPQRTPDGIIVLMVCERIVPEIVVRSDEEKIAIVQSQLINDRLNLAAKRYFRDLKRASFIDVRLGRK
jgi:peptidyl-prolyl cis-trans isomerase SurA